MNTTAKQFPNNRQRVIELLGYDEWSYNNLIHKFFVLWCEVTAMNFRNNDRDLICDEMLYRYYQMQWQIMVESKLVRELKEYIEAGVKDDGKIYYDILSDHAKALESHYPPFLTKSIQHKEPVFDFTLN